MQVDDSVPVQQSASVWPVIDAFFAEKGLVSQQIDSYDDFVDNKLQEIVCESRDLCIVPARQFDNASVAAAATAGFGGAAAAAVRDYRVRFGQLHVARPMRDGAPLYPFEARMRGLTYTAALYVDMEKVTTYESGGGGAAASTTTTEKLDKVFVGHLPVMLHSKLCYLRDMAAHERTHVKECVHDQGGYFVVNGGELVLVAQERMAPNTVYTYRRTPPSKYSHVAEIRSVLESGQLASSTVYVGMLASSGTIEVTMPYVRAPIPLMLLFRALGELADRDILLKCVYALDDTEMVRALEPSLREADAVRTHDVALDYIGKRGAATGVSRDERIRYARDVLQKIFMPHMGIADACEQAKAFFLGRMVHALLRVFLKRATPNDRDHYGHKRIDMAGALLASLFRALFRTMLTDMKRHIQRAVDDKGVFNLTLAVKSSIVSEGLRYSIATGNWGLRGGAVAITSAVRTGVSQQLNRLTYSATLSHLRRINTPVGREGKLTKPRQLHNTHWGMVCARGGLVFYYYYYY